MIAKIVAAIIITIVAENVCDNEPAQCKRAVANHTRQQAWSVCIYRGVLSSGVSGPCLPWALTHEVPEL